MYNVNIILKIIISNKLYILIKERKKKNCNAKINLIHIANGVK